MSTQEVRAPEWKLFCERVGTECRDALVDIDVQQADGTRTEIARDAPLRALTLDDQSDRCNTQLVIETGTEHPARHVVLEPIHIRARNEPGGDRYNRLEILAENGMTIIVLHPGISEELLRKVA